MQNRETCYSKDYFLKLLPFAGRVSIEASRHEQNQSCSPLFFARGGWYVASHFKCKFLASISWLPCRNLPLPDPNKVAADAVAPSQKPQKTASCPGRRPSGFIRNSFQDLAREAHSAQSADHVESELLRCPLSHTRCLHTPPPDRSLVYPARLPPMLAPWPHRPGHASLAANRLRQFCRRCF